MARHKNDKVRSQTTIAQAIEKNKNKFSEMKRDFPYIEERSSAYKPEDFGKRVRSRRTELNQTQITCAREAGMTPATLSKFELGEKASINPDYLYLLSIALQCSPDYLLGLSKSIDGIVEVNPDGTQRELVPAIKKLEPAPCCLISEIMEPMVVAAVTNCYTKIPRVTFQLISILQSQDEELWTAFCTQLDGLCERHKLVVGHIDENNRFVYS